MDARRAPRGFSLVELIIAMAVALVVIAVATSIMVTQQQAYFNGQQQRLSQTSARAALQVIEEQLQLAGFGIDPAFALDLDRYAPPTALCDSTPMGTCPRDAVDNSDELVFLHRNPAYWVPADQTADPRGKAWRITASDGANTLTVAARQGDSFPVGQIVQAVCPGGRYYAYAQVRTRIAPLAADVSVALDLADVDTTNPFRRQDLTAGTNTGAACFTTGMARLFFVDRYRFHVRPVLLGTEGTRKIYDPYLVLDMGVDTSGNGTIGPEDEIILAEGIELLQVAYVLAGPALTTPMVGATAGTAITLQRATTTAMTGGTSSSNRIITTLFPGPAATGRDSVYVPSSYLGYVLGPPADAARNTDHQANVRAVRVAVLARSPDRESRSVAGIRLDSGFRLLNLNVVPDWIKNNFPNASSEDGYRRTIAESTVSLPNALARGLPYY